MTETDNNTELIDVLRAEIEALRTSSETLIFSFDRVINFALVFLVGGIGVGLTKGHFIIMAIIPFPVVIILGYLLGLNTEGLSRAGQKRYLEERVNSLIGRAYLEEEFVAPTRQGKYKFGRVSVVMMQSVIALLVLLLFIVGFVALLDRPPIYLGLYSFGVTYSLASLGFGVADLSNAYLKAYKAAKASAGAETAPPSSQLHQPPEESTASGSEISAVQEPPIGGQPPLAEGAE